MFAAGSRSRLALDRAGGGVRACVLRDRRCTPSQTVSCPDLPTRPLPARVRPRRAWRRRVQQQFAAIREVRAGLRRGGVATPALPAAHGPDRAWPRRPARRRSARCAASYPARERPGCGRTTCTAEGALRRRRRWFWRSTRSACDDSWRSMRGGWRRTPQRAAAVAAVDPFLGRGLRGCMRCWRDCSTLSCRVRHAGPAAAGQAQAECTLTRVRSGCRCPLHAAATQRRGWTSQAWPQVCGACRRRGPRRRQGRGPSRRGRWRRQTCCSRCWKARLRCGRLEEEARRARDGTVRWPARSGGRNVHRKSLPRTLVCFLSPRRSPCPSRDPFSCISAARGRVRRLTRAACDYLRVRVGVASFRDAALLEDDWAHPSPARDHEEAVHCAECTWLARCARCGARRLRTSHRFAPAQDPAVMGAVRLLVAGTQPYQSRAVATGMRRFARRMHVSARSLDQGGWPQLPCSSRSA